MFYMEKYKDTHFIDGECDTIALMYVIYEFRYLLLFLDLKNVFITEHNHYEIPIYIYWTKQKGTIKMITFFLKLNRS